MTSIGIGWGCTWFAYASDYSRFLPTSMPKKKVFFASVFGQFLPVVWLGLLGATLATVSQKVDPGSLVVNEFGVLAIPVLLLVLHGPIATNILNIYSSSRAAQTLDGNLNRAQDRGTGRRHRYRLRHLPRLPDQLREHLGQLAVRTGHVDRTLGPPSRSFTITTSFGRRLTLNRCTTRLVARGSLMCGGRRSSRSWSGLSPPGASSTGRSAGCKAGLRPPSERST
jgi:Permease for cytosine/purines, uracil, thiamine, allantoin